MKSSSAPDRFIRPTGVLAAPKGCRNKVIYPKRKQALTALNQLRAENPHDPDLDRLMIYKCRTSSHGWHVGHSSW